MDGARQPGAFAFNEPRSLDSRFRGNDKFRKLRLRFETGS